MSEDQKSSNQPKNCPLCAADMPAVRVIDFPFERTVVSCRKSKCGLYGVWIDLDQWNTRPREQELEAELAGANKHNDAAIPLDELLAGISDAVMDFKPDLESDSAGTLLERVQAAAECGRREQELEGVLREASEGLNNAVMFMHNIAGGLTGLNYVQGCKKKTLAIAKKITAALKEEA